MSVTRGASLTIFVVQPAADSQFTADLAATVGWAPAATDLVLLPYLGGIPYLPATLNRAGYHFAERHPSATLAQLAIAARTRGVAVAASTYDVAGEGVFYSTLTLIAADGSPQQNYRQTHGINRPGQHEQLYFQPGETGPVIARLAGTIIGWLLGGDLWVPEAARLLAIAGAEVIICLAAESEADRGLVPALARVRAVENGRPVLVASRSEMGLTGHSVLFHPDGHLIAQSNPERGSASFSLDREEIAAFRRRHDPLRWRHPRLYTPLARFDEETR